MKRLILITTLMFFSASIYCQKNNFKNKIKNPQGTTTTNIKFSKVNGLSNLKSATLGRYKTIPTIAKPVTQNSTGLVKKIVRNNSPVYIERSCSNLKSANITSPEERFYSFFESTSSITRLKNPRESFSIEKIETDKQGITHIKAIQRYKGVEIYGSESTVHFDAKRERFTGRIANLNQEIDVDPKLSSSGAVENTISDLKQQTTVKELSVKEKSILEYNSPKSELVVFENTDHSFSLAYEIEVRPNFIEVWKYFIDAQTGKVLRKFNATNSDGPATANATDLNNKLRTINTYLEKGNYYLIDISEKMFNEAKFEGIINTLNANNTSTKKLDYSQITSSNNTWNNKTAISAHANTIATYKYLYNTFGRNSLNGNGGNIISFINITNDDGTAMDNAFWNGQAAFYGNGSEFKPLAGAQDVISHELGHGVVSNSADLEYYAQSGAINESFADIFGSMVDRDNWTIGEAISKTGAPMRNMQDPANGGKTVFDGWQPKHMSEIVTGEVLDNFSNRDQEGVHINSGIGNHAFYLFATAVSKEKAEQVFYQALTKYLTKTSQFIDLRIAVVQSAKDLYGENSTEASEAAKAFDQVGIYDETTVQDDQDYEVNQGEDFILSYNNDDTYPYKLYRTTTSGTDFIALTKTDMKGKASVTDDGAVAVYVSTDDKIRALVLDPKTIEEVVISSEAFWDNAAVSKDGMRVAAISNESDASIFVYDFGTEKWMQFQLYNPTTSESNTNAGGVKYADEIEFDITGEYLIYDAYNEFTSTTTDDISYWDIGFIKVWDNEKNTFGDGNISKLIGSMPEKVSIGNPVFSKNSPDIIAFDYFYEPDDEYAIFGANLQTSDVDVIYTNTTLGFPNFSKLDDRIAFNAISTSDNEVVGVIKLAENKISSIGDAELLIDQAKWPVYYATGNRILGLPPTTNFTADYKIGNAPFNVRFFDGSINNPTSWKWTFTGGTPASSSEKNPVVTYNNPGIYQVSLEASNSYGKNTSTKTNYIEVAATNGINETLINTVSFYPNPVTNILNISCNSDFILKLFNLNGKLIRENKNQKQIDLSGVEPGLYFIELETENGTIRNKMIKN